MAARAVVFVNPGATYGTGRERWRAAEAGLRELIGEFDVEELPGRFPERPGAELATRLRERVGAGCPRVVAAGGDGTVNLLLNAVMELPPDADVTLGAVGLGSSNDFMKPLDDRAVIAGMPVRVDFERAVACDVMRVDFEDPGGSARTRYSLVNASLGVTAEANARFNTPNWFVRAVRPLSVDAAITAAVVSTLATWRDLTCGLSLGGGEPEMVSVTNLGVYKNRHFGGELRYDKVVEPDDGTLGVALCEGLTTWQTLATLSALRRGEFGGRPKTRSWTAREVAVSADREFALETDGEVVRAKNARFTVLPRRVRCCV